MMQNAMYYMITVLIWGSTWLAIKFQLGVVAPEISIAYRFSLSAILLFLFGAVRRLPMKFNWRQHLSIAGQGLFLFSFNYFLVYLAEGYLTSGLVAILFSTIIIANVILGALFLGSPVRRRIVLGAIVGIAGVGIIFYPELSDFDNSGGRGLGVLLTMLSVISASLGNILSAHNQRNNLPVIQTNAFGMAYGAVFMFILAAINGATLTFDTSFNYVTSLLYLALFGSVIAFGAYLTLLGKIGADRAAYVTVLFPVISLSLSTLFEGMTWGLSQLSGVVLVLVGNAIVLTKIRSARAIFVTTSD
jgi:drug/metabolite transporter (DMT)-like permease